MARIVVFNPKVKFVVTYHTEINGSADMHTSRFLFHAAVGISTKFWVVAIKQLHLQSSILYT